MLTVFIQISASGHSDPSQSTDQCLKNGSSFCMGVCPCLTSLRRDWRVCTAEWQRWRFGRLSGQRFSTGETLAQGTGWDLMDSLWQSKGTVGRVWLKRSSSTWDVQEGNHWIWSDTEWHVVFSSMEKMLERGTLTQQGLTRQVQPSGAFVVIIIHCTGISGRLGASCWGPHPSWGAEPLRTWKL